MVRSEAASVTEYLEGLEPALRKEIEAVRNVILKNLPDGYEEVMDYGMISYVVPLATYPDTYNEHPLPVAALAAQKNYNSLYLMSIYADPATTKWFESAYAKSGKKLDMGKSCVRFRRADDLALDVIARAVGRVSVKDYVASVEAARNKRR